MMLTGVLGPRYDQQLEEKSVWDSQLLQNLRSPVGAPLAPSPRAVSGGMRGPHGSDSSFITFAGCWGRARWSLVPETRSGAQLSPPRPQE